MNVRTNTPNNNTFLLIKPIVTIVLLLIGHYFVAAQPQPMSELWAHRDATTSTKTEAWSFLSGKNSVYYLDFDELGFQLEHIELRTISGKVLFTDEVGDLSTFTLYELDFTKFPMGEYFLELKTKNKTLRKVLKLK